MPSKNSQGELDAVLQQAIDHYQGGQPAAAISLLRKESRRHPDSARLWGYLGFVQKERGLFNDAVKSFKNAVSLSPTSEKASLGLFFSLYRAGRAEQALREVFRFLRHSDSAEYLKIFRGMAFAPVNEAVSA